MATERIEVLHPDAARRLGVPVQTVKFIFTDNPVVATHCFDERGRRLGGCISNGPDDPDDTDRKT